VDKKLLFSLSKTNGDFVITPYKGSGKGGQKRNKTMSGCRITHPATGLYTECEEERYFEVNKRRAFDRLVSKPEFNKWLKLEIAKRQGKLQEIDDRVEREMKNIRVDVKDAAGRWVDEKNIPVPGNQPLA
jgi:protein subunit release factor B